MAEPLAPEELWEEILLRLPPDDPASLLRASLVCNQWRHIVSRRGFLRRLAQLHGAPPILGFFEDTVTFVPATAGSALSFPVPERRARQYFVDCRHGRALLLDRSAGDLLVCEPIMGYRRRVPFPEAKGVWRSLNAAVVCAADGCDHSSCHGGPFRVVLVRTSGGTDTVVSASTYLSETGVWGEPSTTPVAANISMYCKGSILVGNSLYFLRGFFEIIKYDLGGQGRMVVEPVNTIDNYGLGIILMKAEDGGLGLARVEGSSLYLWSRQMSDNADTGFVLRRTIHLDNLLPAAVFLKAKAEEKVAAQAVGFAEGANVIFLRTTDDIFTIGLKSGQARKVGTSTDAATLLPFLSFYVPGILKGGRKTKW